MEQENLPEFFTLTICGNQHQGLHTVSYEVAKMKLLSIYSILAGASYFIWWWSFSLILPDADFSAVINNYPGIIKNPLWIPINLFQLIGITSLVLFFNDFSAVKFKKNFIDIISKILFTIGLVLFSGIAFYETILWPIVADNAPEILDLRNSPIYASPLYLTTTGIAILFFMLGGLSIGNKIRHDFRITGIIFSTGLVIFCLGYLAGPVRYIVQSIGLSAWTLALIYTGINLRSI